MKIIIIARAIYPALSPRAHRATELAKQFAAMGHKVILYGVLGKFDYTTFCKSTHIQVKPIKMQLSTSDSDGNLRYNLIDKFAYHAFGKLLEYPDIEFCWKVPFILRKEQNVDLLITIAHPHPIHWGAALAKKKLGQNFPKYWISDCGDPYLNNPLCKRFFYFKYVENFWGKMTDFVTLPIESARQAYQESIQSKIAIIPQGFNFEEINIPSYKQNKVVSFAYSGSIYPGYRDPYSMLDYLAGIDIDFKFSIFTNSPNAYAPYQEKLGKRLVINNYMPRNELIVELAKQDFLINLVNPHEVQSPSKLIDYIQAKRPIIDISTPFKEERKLSEALHWNITDDHRNADISAYDIKNIAKSFINLINTENED